MQVDVGYPDLAAERTMMIATTGASMPKADPVLNADELMRLQALIRRVPIGETVVDAILKLVRAGRPDTSDLPDIKRNVSWGPGPRASQALMLAARARAVLDGRLSPSLDDVLALAGPILRHRMALTFAARAEGETIQNVIKRLKARIG
jgi:MoxR-like ATPase